MIKFSNINALISAPSFQSCYYLFKRKSKSERDREKGRSTRSMLRRKYSLRLTDDDALRAKSAGGSLYLAEATVRSGGDKFDKKDGRGKRTLGQQDESKWVVVVVRRQWTEVQTRENNSPLIPPFNPFTRTSTTADCMQWGIRCV